MFLVSVPAPSQPHITAILATDTSISLSWASIMLVEDSYEVKWEEVSNDGSSNSASETEDDDDGSGISESTGGDPTIMTDDGDEESGTSGSNTDTSYTIEDLKSNTTYIITVTVTNAAGNRVSHPIRITTGKIKHIFSTYQDLITLVYCL